MLKARIEETGEIESVRVVLSGTLDEHDRLAALFGAAAAYERIEVCCERIVRLNSPGVREWIRFFERLRERGARVSFSGCSVTMVDFINRIYNFCRPGEIDSIQLPFFCAHCRSEWAACIPVRGLSAEAAAASFVAPRCRGCQRETEFDDFADQYFGFLRRVERRSAPWLR